MSIFTHSSHYYDMFYENKPYQEESEKILQIAHDFIQNKFSILDLGCGTGGHLYHFLKKGYCVTGVDGSTEMLSKARKKVREFKNSSTFVRHDIRTLQLNATYDLVVSLFHVASYMITNEDILSFLSTIHRHLTPSGIAIFDVWYGPGVLTNRPENRLSKYENEHIVIDRIKEPKLFAHENTVEVTHHLYVYDKKKKQTKKYNEVHLMRYYFFMELLLLIKQTGLEVISWGTLESKLTQPPSPDSWDAYLLVKRK